MSEASFASLGPTLLARKGGAKPAMRPQLAPLPANFGEEGIEAELEDLGWNDMGTDSPEPTVETSDEDESEAEDLIVDPLAGADIVSITSRKPKIRASALAPANEDPVQLESPIVRRQQRRLAERILSDAVVGTQSADSNTQVGAPAAENQNTTKSRKVAKPSSKQGRRAAFTLRLDTERHLKLRLAATMQGVSAQALVTEALDAMLGEIDDLDALAARMKRH